MRARAIFTLATVIALSVSCNNIARSSDSPSSSASSAEVTVNVLAVSEVQWEKLNPARGDKSPQAATLWGDRSGEVPTGFLVKFIDGFSSPPHIHNVTYRGVVIHGRIHNDDPDAAEMWMPPGSYWNQPAGEVHITAARGAHNVAFIEIGRGPYLVKPPAEAFDNGERPVNVEASNMVWLDASHTTWIDAPEPTSGPRLTHLWGSPPGLNGSLLEIPAGKTCDIVPPDVGLRAVTIRGTPVHKVPKKTDPQALAPGSMFSSRGGTVHRIQASKDAAAVLYIRAQGTFRVVAE